MCFPRISFSFKKAKKRDDAPDVQLLETLESGAAIGEQAALPTSGAEPLPTGNENSPVPSHAANDSAVEATEDDPAASDPGRGAWRTAKAAAITALSLAEKILDGLPVPGAKGTIGAVLLIIQKIDKASANVETLKTLESQVNQLRDKALIPFHDNQQNLPDDLRKDLEDLLNTLDKLGQVWISRRNRGTGRRILDSTEDDLDLQDFNEGIRRAIAQFEFSGSIQLRLTQNQHTKDLTKISVAVNAIEIRSSSVNNLPRANEASFSSGRIGAPSLCFAGTRETILKTVQDWLVDKTRPNVFWLNGLAGIGKSTIAMTLSKNAHELELLGGSFFFSRGDKASSDPGLVFPTLAFQLAQYDSDFKQTLGNVLDNNPSYGYDSAQIQLDKLIISPLRDSQLRRKSLLFVIDALDECSHKEKTVELLQLILAYSNRFPSGLRVFITSRPENHIRSIFNQEHNVDKIVLHDIEASIVRNDIYLYLKEELTRLPKRLAVRVGPNWPKEDDLQALVEKSGRFFIYAATALKFVSKDPPRTPQRHLDILLGLRQVTNDKLLPYRDLDTLYLAVLRNAYPEDTEEENAERFRWVVGCIVLLLDPLPRDALGRFTLTDPDDISDTLYHLHSVIICPTSLKEAPHIYHPSFRDFLTERCEDRMFAVVRAEQERRLLLRCLDLMMETLTRDVAHVGNYWDDVSDSKHLKDAADRTLTPEIQYSCLHWATHLVYLKESDDEILTRLNSFASDHLLHWFEVMSLLSATPLAVFIIQDVHRWVVAFTSNERLKSLCYDGYRFILSYQVPIAKGPSQVYRSALAFTPKETLLYKMYQQELHNCLHVLHGVGPRWSPRLTTVQCGWGGSLTSVTYSPTGQYFATGTSSSRISVWDATSYDKVVSFDHDGEIYALCFTPDGHHLLSANSNGVICIWDIISSTAILSLDGHSAPIHSLSARPKTSIFASASVDATVRIWNWNITSGSQIALLPHGQAAVFSVVFFPDGSFHLLSGAADKQIRLWDAERSTVLRIFKGNTGPIRTLSISADGLQFASGSDDNSIRIFSLSGESDNDAISTLKGHTKPIHSVAFSPINSSQLVSGGPDEYMTCGWDINSQNVVATFRGKIAGIAYAPDGRTFISAHTDGTYRIWDAMATPEAKDPADHTDFVHALTFSLDGRLIATAGGHVERSVKIWDAIAGKHLHTLLGHDWAVYSLSFSPDGSKLASGSGDYTARVWDVESGTGVAVLHHPSYVKHIDFHEDGRQVVSQTDEMTYIWDLEHPEIPTDTKVGVGPDPTNSMYGLSEGFSIYMGEAHWLFMGPGSDERPVGAVPEEFRVCGFVFHSDRLVVADVSGSVLILDTSRLKKEFQV
ncbi:hypothetical protein HYPSUDRAFT_80696 [Hypholoma sublateritium FD-334 SS-4]|uniref:NACHT domain-containing protein n=1 Tax=Hypholoma sublateritium (strain FD-334 SS-4) TaxID=945553 RepID=A0A0D2P2P1_HYPSF|nr:hypothetical protein HYPSUDRAFT_80696 [Hypholoma sublateritium FD-334 SS-4]